VLPNSLLCIDAVEGLRALPSASIPLTVTSPPYDAMRDYGGHLWDHEKFALIAHGLWRVMMPGGVVCWVVRDQLTRGSLTGTSHRQVRFFRGLGFLHDSTIYVKSSGWRRPETRRYADQVTPCYVLSKRRPRAFTPIRDRLNKTAGRKLCYSRRKKDGVVTSHVRDVITPAVGVRGNVWEYATGGRSNTSDTYAYEHPALMPEELARDLIVSWSRPGDIVLDPLGGAGTTAKMALLSDRQYLSFEVHRPYHEIAVRRLADAHTLNRRRLEAALDIG
jgi:site-specific DNA-methyltransferase (adenine-specific)